VRNPRESAQRPSLLPPPAQIVMGDGNHAFETVTFTQLECLSIVSGLEAASINFLAVDFDLTLVAEHTRGTYEGDANMLSLEVRPFFRMLIPMAVSRGISVGVVTFSPQVQLIEEVLKMCFPECDIPVRGNDGSWNQSTHSKGKQEHIESLAQAFHENVQ
jgi:hypothetical protein